MGYTTYINGTLTLDPQPEDHVLEAVAKHMSEAARTIDVPFQVSVFNDLVYNEKREVVGTRKALDVSDDPLDLPDARRHLLRGLDGLSLVLARQGLSEEALAVVDDAASLGLLEGGDDVGAVHRAALNARREELLRAIFQDSTEA